MKPPEFAEWTSFNNLTVPANVYEIHATGCGTTSWSSAPARATTSQRSCPRPRPRRPWTSQTRCVVVLLCRVMLDWQQMRKNGHHLTKFNFNFGVGHGKQWWNRIYFLQVLADRVPWHNINVANKMLLTNRSLIAEFLLLLEHTLLLSSM